VCGEKGKEQRKDGFNEIRRERESGCINKKNILKYKEK